MPVRICWSKTRPNAWDELANRYRRLMELRVPRMISRIVTRDVNDPESIFTITLWDSMESLLGWECSDEYASVYLAAVSPHLVGSHSVSLCEVVASSLPALPLDNGAPVVSNPPGS